jgi:hypothetical protein
MHILMKCTVQEEKSPVKNLVRQHCAEIFYFGVKGLNFASRTQNYCQHSVEFVIPDKAYSCIETSVGCSNNCSYMNETIYVNKYTTTEGKTIVISIVKPT